MFLHIFFGFFERFWAFSFAWIFVQVFFWCWCHFLPGAAVNRHLPSASPSLCARCCFRRFPGIGVGLGIENDESWWKDHQGTMKGIGWEIHHEQVGDSPWYSALFVNLWLTGRGSRWFSLKFHNGFHCPWWFWTRGSQVQYLVVAFFEGFVEVQRAFFWQNHRKSACILKEALNIEGILTFLLHFHANEDRMRHTFVKLLQRRYSEFVRFELDLTKRSLMIVANHIFTGKDTL